MKGLIRIRIESHCLVFKSIKFNQGVQREMIAEFCPEQSVVKATNPQSYSLACSSSNSNEIKEADI
jgi:hypothetical protein